MSIVKNPDTMTGPNEATALLHDLFSVAFAYPHPEFIATLGNGKFVEVTKQCLDSLKKPEPLATALRSFERGLDSLPPEFIAKQLESDYIALFELDTKQTPLYLNAHLYSDAKPNPVPVYQRLIETYQSAGIELKSGEGVEQPDHLSVELEFQGYLYRLLDKTLRGETDSSAQTISAAIDDFRKELAWVQRWLAALEVRGGHPVYGPLGKLLWSVLDNTQPVSG